VALENRRLYDLEELYKLPGAAVTEAFVSQADKADKSFSWMACEWTSYLELFSLLIENLIEGSPEVV
jgi:hypothetical protein